MTIEEIKNKIIELENAVKSHAKEIEQLKKTCDEQDFQRQQNKRSRNQNPNRTA